jgi:diketogulonate reductase-like aldo/keto reductase
MALQHLSFDVRGQKGAVPALGLGTATLFADELIGAIRHSIRVGIRHFDTALLYNNQEAVGRAIADAIAAGDVTRADLFVTTKVAFYPAAHDGRNGFAPIAFHPLNRKTGADTAAAIDHCLALLRLDYVDLLLIHNPLTDLAEYAASAAPHAFELSNSLLRADERELILARRLAAVQHTGAAGEAVRADCWRALEAAQVAGKARFIGVSNYPAPLIAAMTKYATVLPAVNQLEFHPRASSPALRALARDMGFVLTAYGSGNSVRIEKNAAVAEIAARRGVSPNAVVLLWTIARGVVVIPRTKNAVKIEENWATCTRESPLTAEDLETLDAMNEAHFYCERAEGELRGARFVFTRTPRSHPALQIGRRCRAYPQAHFPTYKS